MGRQSQFKQARQVVNKQKNKVIIDYIRNNWDIVLEASIGMIKTFTLPKRLKIAASIVFIKKKIIQEP